MKPKAAVINRWGRLDFSVASSHQQNVARHEEEFQNFKEYTLNQQGASEVIFLKNHRILHFFSNFEKMLKDSIKPC